MTTNPTVEQASGHDKHASAKIYLVGRLMELQGSHGFDTVRHEATIRTCEGAYLHVFTVFDPVHPGRTPTNYVIRMIDGEWVIVS